MFFHTSFITIDRLTWPVCLIVWPAGGKSAFIGVKVHLQSSVDGAMKGYTVSCVGRSGGGLETFIWLASDLLELGACELDTLGNLSLMKNI